MSAFLKQFFPQNHKLFVTEFGHSIKKEKTAVGPWSREIYILHFVVKGTCEFSGFTANQGQAFLISQGLRHSFTVSEDYEHYWIGFNGYAVKELFAFFQLESAPHQLYFVENTEFAEILFSNTLKKLTADDAGTPESIVLSLLTAFLPLLKTESRADLRRETNYAEKVQKFIQTNYANPLRMADIAKEIHITEKYMYRLFLNRFGMPPQKFLLKTRMEAAKNLLMQTDLTIKEVASSVGYSSLPSFSKAFSDFYLKSPSAFKKTKQN